MQVIHGVHNLSTYKNCVATIGNFDGVHLGHQAVLHKLIARAQDLKLPSTVITFEPLPQEYFTRKHARLTSLREKLAIIQEIGIDIVLLLRFNAKLMAMPAETFIEQILVQKLGVKFLFVGDDFHFGQLRRGNFQLLRDSGAEYGFTVETMPTACLSGERISSTRIREALRCDELETASHLLGRPYRLCGRVSHGAKRGRLLGFPTANLNLHRQISPVHGVYAVRVLGEEGQNWTGVANIGQRPTVTGDKRVLLEAHLFDFSGDLYHKHIAVELIHKLRNEQHFASFDELRQQINLDAKQARDLFVKYASAPK